MLITLILNYKFYIIFLRILAFSFPQKFARITTCKIHFVLILQNSYVYSLTWVDVFAFKIVSCSCWLLKHLFQVLKMTCILPEWAIDQDPGRGCGCNVTDQRQCRVLGNIPATKLCAAAAAVCCDSFDPPRWPLLHPPTPSYTAYMASFLKYIIFQS